VPLQLQKAASLGKLRMHRFGLLIVAGAATLALGGCEKSSKQDQLAYEACLASAKKDAKVASAAFATLEQSKITGSTGEEEMRVNIPYKLDGKKATYQCIAQKQPDGTFKAIF
jgi:hypothetical protein